MVPDSKKPSAKDQIKKNLQRVYDEAFEEDLPAEFEQLLARLREEKAKTDDR